jgi:tetratricopeptide (TPR) repeat protein
MPPPIQQVVNQAQQYFKAGQFEQARDAARTALKLKKDHPVALHVLGASLGRLGQNLESRKHLRKLVRFPGRPPRVFFDLGYTYQAEGKLDRALDVLRQGIQQCPHDGFLLRAAAELLRMMRRPQDAFELLQPEIEAGNTDPDVVVAFVVACKQSRNPRPAIDLVEPRLGDLEMDDTHRMHAHFALGQCNETLDRYDNAFEHYARANALKGATFDPAEHARVVDRVIASWTSEAIAALPHPAIDTSRLVIVGGMPRSGTSLVEQILSVHPDVAPGGEINRLVNIVGPARDEQSPPAMYLHDPGVLTQAEVDRIALEYMQVLREIDPRTRYVTDKVPLNVTRLGEINAALPDARIIICRRDAIDTCLSCFSFDFGGRLPWAYDLSHLGAFYRDYERLVEHWKRVVDLRIHEVVYEELVSDQERCTRALLDFLDLPFHEPCLRPHESGRLTRTASMEQVTRPVYKTSLGRADRFGANLDPLRAALNAERTTG